MDYKINSTYEVAKTQEFSVDWNGYGFLVIYGKHINGWFIAIPNWNICTEAGEPTDVIYNTEKLAAAFRNASKGQAIAEAIKKYSEGME